MAVAAPAAFPFVEVEIDLKGLQPTAQRAPGVIAVVGTAAGSATAKQPLEVGGFDDAASMFGSGSTLEQALRLAMLQDPKPSKIYGVKIATVNDYADGLGALDGMDDITFVSLANEPNVGAAGNKLNALKAHVESASAAGNRRIGVAMVDPQTAKTNTYVNDVKTTYSALKGSSPRMVLVAARGAKDEQTGQPADVATAAMAAIAGYDVHISTVLKPIRGIRIARLDGTDVVPAPELFYTPTEITGLSDQNMIPIIDPALIPGEGLYFGEARVFTTDASRFYIDIVRTLDKVEFDLKAGLITSIGDARITKAGMMSVRLRTEAILGTLLRNEVIDAFKVQIPVLEAILIPEAARSPVDKKLIADARATRNVEMLCEITYGPAVHLLNVKLKPVFA
jgi:hypothetical protein